MFIEQPPLLYRMLFPEGIWRIRIRGRKVAYLTFDDGPIPEVTPWVLDVLDHYGVKATFFMVGDNVRHHPELLDEVKRRGHSVGNHTMHHVQGRKTSTKAYLSDIDEADELIKSDIFRPPHGLLKWSQSRAVNRHYNIIMYDVVTRDYARYIDADEVVDNVRQYTRDGSIIVFHDSLRSIDKLREALPRSIEWLLEQGYELLPLNPPNHATHTSHAD